ncbi:MAG TPA: HAMP domain-containing sensor histidine kinase [Planctomycetota bacterium]|nr:HAMP domain-containing sensor histidine kinase [Planctomycetota bacterium]HRR82091.1 HAMP domain-containing sensor histidine kinase [Planctomycetota bacterium]HRT96454.1 HAMP domain-containing sensor histidine kinase [Planctomycetota bacterium]
MAEEPSSTAPPLTHFAPAERASAEALRQAVDAVSAHPVMDAALRTFSGILMVLNAQRQIVAVNPELLRFLGCPDPEATLGMRPGEALQCIHARDNPLGGCGTGPACRSCGAAVAIVASLESDTAAEAECLLTARTAIGREEPFEFRVRAAPIELNGQRLLVISLQDIRDQKRREALEAVFLHDLMNTASALDGTLRLLARCAPAERDELLRDAIGIARRLTAEIAEQQDLVELEAGSFRPSLSHLSLRDVRDMAEALAATLGCAHGKSLSFNAEDDGPTLFTDPTLLTRALGNLLKNAFEATPPGGQVLLACRGENARAVLEVWNAAAIPPAVALRVFQRYFTTKGRKGRGLGAYGARLIVERYLGGRLTFTSSEAEGTTFRIELPVTPPAMDRTT